jgi:hypothetical protein
MVALHFSETFVSTYILVKRPENLHEEVISFGNICIIPGVCVLRFVVLLSAAILVVYCLTLVIRHSVFVFICLWIQRKLNVLFSSCSLRGSNK